MSQENVEIVRRAIDAFNQVGVAGLVAHADPEIVAYPIPEWLEDDVYHGHDGIRRIHAWQDDFDRVEWDTLEIRAVADSVIVHANISARTKAGGAIQQEFSAVCGRFTGGKVGELHYYRSWPEALEAVGLEE